MKPSPELDALVAEKVLGWQALTASAGETAVTLGWLSPEGAKKPHGLLVFPDKPILPAFSVDIAAAWGEVWPKLLELHKERFTWKGDYAYTPTIIEDDGKYGIDFVYQNYDEYPNPTFFGTLPHAICVTALEIAAITPPADAKP